MKKDTVFASSLAMERDSTLFVFRFMFSLFQPAQAFELMEGDRIYSVIGYEFPYLVMSMLAGQLSPYLLSFTFFLVMVYYKELPGFALKEQVVLHIIILFVMF